MENAAAAHRREMIDMLSEKSEKELLTQYAELSNQLDVKMQEIRHILED